MYVYSQKCVRVSSLWTCTIEMQVHPAKVWNIHHCSVSLSSWLKLAKAPPIEDDTISCPTGGHTNISFRFIKKKNTDKANGGSEAYDDLSNRYETQTKIVHHPQAQFRSTGERETLRVSGWNDVTGAAPCSLLTSGHADISPT